MKILTKRCVFNPVLQAWELVPVIIEAISPKEFKAALKAFASEVERFDELTQSPGGDDGQA